jgi:hypothetical protein
MTRRSQQTGRAEYAQALREHVAAERAVAAALAELSAARAKPAPAAVPRLNVGAARAVPSEIGSLERKLALAKLALGEIGKRLADARERALGGESGFEHLSAAHPLLMLPVRLETRFGWSGVDGLSFEASAKLEQVLLVRIYPDEVHEDSHEPELTPNEVRWVGEFRRKVLAATDNPPIAAAWAELIARAGPTRAAWLGQAGISGVNPGKRASIFTRSSLARLLPDRWVAFATLPDGSTLTAMSSPVREPLETGPAPTGMDWMLSFDSALKAGMALIVRAIPATVSEIGRLVVVGARGTLDPLETQSQLEKLLGAHRHTRGLELLTPGTATNCSPGTRAGFSTRPALPEVIALESRRYQVGGRVLPLCQPGDQSDGTALATALGIEPAVFAFTARADGSDQVDGRHMRSILTTATQRPLARLLEHIVDRNAVDQLLAFAVQQTSALGPLPTLRIGSQPYGILPVMLTAGARFDEGSNAARYLPVLDRMRGLWESAASGLDRVGKNGADPGQTLIRILQRDGVAARIAFRPFLGPTTGAAMSVGLAGRSAAKLAAQRGAAATALDALGARRSASAPLLQTMLLPMAPALTDPVVQPEDGPAGSEQLAAQYLELIASLPPDKLLQHDYGGGERPRALFFAIARLAMLEQADVFARQLLIGDGASDAHWDDETLPSYYQDPLGTALSRLTAPDPGDRLEQIAFHLSPLGRNAMVLDGVRATLRHFKTRPPDLIELHLRAGLGLFSNRLDAWYTALASEQLTYLRAGVNSSMGINAGGYGVLENITRAPRQPVANTSGLFSVPTNGGYVHAPSANHGAAAAVLRSVHLAHAASGRGAAFSIDLSSERVRRALPLLEGIRAGQPLAALLGYRLERELGAEALQRFIAPLRAIAPLLANKLTPSTQAVETVAASNVIDGLTLLEVAGYDGDRAATVAELWRQYPSLGAALNPAESQAMQRVLDFAQDAVDAVSDLVLADGVYQAVQGNPTRAAAAVDSASGAPVPPPELGVIRTPRSGVGATFRVMTLFDAAATATGTGWATTARAICEPRLEAWCAGVLPRPGQIRLRARFRGGGGDVLATLDDLTLGDLFEAAADQKAEYLQFGALDVVALASPSNTPQRSAFELRLAALLELERPAEAGEGALELVYERGGAWDATQFGVVETLEIAGRLRDVIGQGRPVAPEDLAQPGQAPGLFVEGNEHARRAQLAADELGAVRAQLAAVAVKGEAQELREALFAAEALGVVGAAPTSLRDLPAPAADTLPRLVRQHAQDEGRLLGELRVQASAVLVELGKRTKRLADAAADPSARLKAVFGDGFVTLPLMSGAGGATIAIGTVPAGASGAAMRAWLARAARVRESMRLLDGALGAAQAVALTQKGGAPPHLDVRQLGGPAGEPWVALPLAAGASLPGGRVSLLAATAGTLPTTSMAGLFIDEWLEVVPSTSEITSVTFHYEAPSSAPPQLMLLGVPTPGLEHWTAEAARGLVAEALDLGRIRLVDMDDLPDLGQVLPAFVTAENSTGAVAGLDVEALTRGGPS